MTDGNSFHPVKRFREDGFDVCEKDDGAAYWRIIQAYRSAGIDRDTLMARQSGGHDPVIVATGTGTMEFHPLVYNNPKRMVFKVIDGGRQYILKWMRRGSAGLNRVWPWGKGLTYHTRLFEMVRRAVDGGCVSTQDYRLVAEKWLSTFRMEAFVLLEYVEGVAFAYKENQDALLPALRRSTEDLIRHGLTLDDLSPYNFLVGDDGVIRFIDLSCRFPTRLNAVKMIMKMNNRYGIDLPVRGWRDTLLRSFLAARYAVLGRLGGKEFK